MCQTGNKCVEEERKCFNCVKDKCRNYWALNRYTCMIEDNYIARDKRFTNNQKVYFFLFTNIRKERLDKLKELNTIKISIIVNGN